MVAKRNEVLLYDYIYSDSAVEFSKAIEAITEGDLVVRLCTPGGEPEYLWSMVKKFADFTGRKIISAEGQAHSGGFFFCCYADEVECLDVTQFLIHRAAYSEYFERSEMFTPAIKENLERDNANLRKAFEASVDVKLFEQLKGVKVKDIFSMDGRVEVYINAKEAKQIGLVQKVIPITPTKRAQIEADIRKAASRSPMYRKAASSAPAYNPNPTKNSNMTIDELKADNPALYNSIFNKGVESGTATERDRVGACLAYLDADPKEVTKIIKEGGDLTRTQVAEFSIKLASQASLKSIEKENAPDLHTEGEQPAAAKTADEKELEAFRKKVEADRAKKK